VVEEVPARQEKRDHLFIWAAAPALAIMTRKKRSDWGVPLRNPCEIVEKENSSCE
jgi:hypothetical protein